MVNNCNSIASFKRESAEIRDERDHRRLTCYSSGRTVALERPPSSRRAGGHSWAVFTLWVSGRGVRGTSQQFYLRQVHASSR